MAHQPFTPDHLGTTNKIMSCPVAQRKFYNDLHSTVCLGRDEQGNFLFGSFSHDPLLFHPAEDLQPPAPPTLKSAACPRCGSDIYVYEAHVVARVVVPPWETLITMVDWQEKNDANVFPDTRTAWEKWRSLVQAHEEKHQSDYKRLFVDVVNLRYARYYCKYQAAYCVNANPDHANMAKEDLEAMRRLRADAFEESYQDTSAYEAAAETLEKVDYDNMKQRLEQFVEAESGNDLWAMPLRNPGQ